MSEVVSFGEHHIARSSNSMRSGTTPLPVFFSRRELSEILQVYGQMVAKSEWRDYAIGQAKHSCSFAVFHRTTEKPLYSIVKEPKLAAKQGEFSVIAHTGRILKRGKTLANVLRVFDKKRLKTVD